MSEENIVVALAGQPNVGKSMLINSISNSNEKVGNFAGVTVEKAEACLTYANRCIDIIDLPGTYALNDYSLDEKVAKEYLEKGYYDLILNVVDSTNLERNLELTFELLSLGKKVVVALNMSDEAQREGVHIDEKQMSKILGVPCIKISAKNKVGLDELLNEVIKSHSEDLKENKIIYSEPVEEEIFAIEGFFRERGFESELSHRILAVELLKKNKKIYKQFHEDPLWPELLPLLREAYSHLYVHYDTKDLDDIFYEEREGYIKGILTETVSKESVKKESLTEKADKILLHKFFGIPIFLFLMWSLFQLTFELGAVPMDYIDAAIGVFGEKIGGLIASEGIRSLVVDGIIAGVGAVLLFLPNIVILFLGIAILETTGYIARVAFLLDGFFHKFGLHGKSFIPLVTGFGCSVPAYMAARTLKNEKDRLITMFIIGFMSCGAKLPVYVLFVGAFFSPGSAGNVLFLIYILGALIGLAGAKFLEKFVFGGGDEPFVMEMPKYRWPSNSLVWHTVYSKAAMYIKKAGTFILAASILIWFASNYPKNLDIVESYEKRIELAVGEDKKTDLENALNQELLENSYLGMIGKATAPVFAPLGFDWKLTVALETGLAAKEVIVATLGVLYSLGDEVDEEHGGLMSELKENIPLPTAMAFLTFTVFYLPCLAATVVFTKEAGNKKYLGMLIVFTTFVAYAMAFLVYTISSAFI